MIRSTRFQPLLLMTLGLAVATLGCGSGGGGSAGSGGSGGAGGTSGGALRILVTNDDGVGAEGIDAIVEALTADPDNDVTVCGPLMDESGTGDTTDCATGNATDTTTQSGYPATAVDGCPADAVNYALDPANGLYAADSLPHVVISGINEGQNVGAPIATSVSGTVGAAKTAARDHGIPALATSQGSSTGVPVAPPAAEYDFDSGAAAALEWLAEHRTALAAGNVATATVDSLNTPTCTAGEIRGLREVPLASDSTDSFKPQDCESTLETPQNDAEAFINGFNALSPVPAN
jgi:5'-nucleotidase